MKWERKKLGEVAKVISGYAFKSKDFIDVGIPVIKIKNIRREYVDLTDSQYLPDSFLSIDPKYLIKDSDILISLTGSHITLPNSVVGRVAQYKMDSIALLNQRAGKIIVVDNESVDNQYLYYFLCQGDVRTEIALFGHGGANQCNISPSNVESIEINLPPLPTQRRIASILSAYDDLIENNLKRIKLLEEAAQNIYREWFVEMRFPGYEKAEWYTDDQGRRLPVGWKYINLYKFADIQMGFAFKANQFNSDGIGTPAIRIRDILNSSTTTFTTEEVDEKYNVVQGDILIGMDGFFYIDIWSGQDGYLVQRVCRIRANEEGQQGYLLEALKSPIKYFEQTISGATVAHLGAKHLQTIEILSPSEEDMHVYKIFNTLHKQRIVLQNQIKILKEALDILLPRLMNRTIEI